MLNAVYRLVAPRRIEVEFSDININSNQVIVRPTYLSICHADQRYYQGARSEEILAKKLPMALIHEGIGEVVNDPTGKFTTGTRVVMIPNTPTERDDIIAENYLRSSKFRASGFDGFMQEYVALEPDRVVELPDNINNHVAAFTELVSVSVHAISRFDKIAHSRRNAVGIWGDGNLGYITAVLFKYMFPKTKLIVFGISEQKLSDFSFADVTYRVNNIPEDLMLDHVFECVGGNGSAVALEQIIDHINPEGTVSLLGVSENPVPINTRMVLEKGLRLFGTSRSGRADFEKTVELFKDNTELVDYLKNLVSEVIEIDEIEDMKKAFDWDMQKIGGKTIMKWKK